MEGHSQELLSLPPSPEDSDSAPITAVNGQAVAPPVEEDTSPAVHVAEEPTDTFQVVDAPANVGVSTLPDELKGPLPQADDEDPAGVVGLVRELVNRARRELLAGQVDEAHQTLERASFLDHRDAYMLVHQAWVDLCRGSGSDAVESRVGMALAMAPDDPVIEQLANRVRERNQRGS